MKKHHFLEQKKLKLENYLFTQTIIQVNFQNGVVDMTVRFKPHLIYIFKFQLVNKRQTN